MWNNIGNCNKYAIDYNVLIVTLLCALYHSNKLPTAVIVIAYQKFVKWQVFVNHAFTSLRFNIAQHMDLFSKLVKNYFAYNSSDMIDVIIPWSW